MKWNFKKCQIYRVVKTGNLIRPDLTHHGLII